jgi:hypothetical protein
MCCRTDSDNSPGREFPEMIQKEIVEKEMCDMIDADSAFNAIVREEAFVRVLSSIVDQNTDAQDALNDRTGRSAYPIKGARLATAVSTGPDPAFAPTNFCATPTLSRVASNNNNRCSSPYQPARSLSAGAIKGP